MTQQQRELVHTILRNAPFDLGGVAAIQRPLLEQMLTAQPLPPDVLVSRSELAGVPVVLASIDGVEPSGILFHRPGGGFAVVPAGGSLGLASALARRTGLSVVSVENRLAPEHPFPAAANDVLAAYSALLEREGGSGRIVVSGESAGGNLAAGRLRGARGARPPPPPFAPPMLPT